MRYNIYAGLGGSFGGATYRGTGDFSSIGSAEEIIKSINNILNE